jgi:hypothetical protein
MQLRVCVGCRRHVGIRETACPFCGCALPVPPAPRAVRIGRVSRAAVFSAALVACSNEPTKQAPPPSAQGSDGTDDLEELLDHQPHVVEVPDAAPMVEPIDAAVEQVASPVDAGVPDAGTAVKKKRRQQQTIEKQQIIERRHMAKPYGAPPARRRIV